MTKFQIINGRVCVRLANFTRGGTRKSSQLRPKRTQNKFRAYLLIGNEVVLWSFADKLNRICISQASSSRRMPVSQSVRLRRWTCRGEWEGGAAIPRMANHNFADSFDLRCDSVDGEGGGGGGGALGGSRISSSSRHPTPSQFASDSYSVSFTHLPVVAFDMVIGPESSLVMSCSSSSWHQFPPRALMRANNHNHSHPANYHKYKFNDKPPKIGCHYQRRWMSANSMKLTSVQIVNKFAHARRSYS